MPQHLQLKLRQPGQNSAEDVRMKNLREELIQAELEYFQSQSKSHKSISAAAAGESVASTGSEEESESAEAAIEENEIQEGEKEARRRALELDNSSDSDSNSSHDSDSENSNSEDEDEEEMLLKELEKIKKERAEERLKDEQKRLAEMEEERELELATGNPLISSTSDTSGVVKRRWDDDVVFKNQAKGVAEHQTKKRFVNDLLRSDFHRKFINKYIK